MRALVVSMAHPDDPTVLARWVRPLADLDWDVTYVAPFADFGVRPPAGLTGLDLPVSRGHRHALRVAAGVLRFRGPDFDVVVVSADDLAAAGGGLRAQPYVARPDGPGLAGVAELDRVVRRSADGRVGSCATPSASGSAGGGPGRSAIPRQNRGTRPAGLWRRGTAAR